MPSEIANTNKKNGMVIAAATTSIIILLSRFLTSNYQIDWDEELYYQIAKIWSQGGIPYRDIFDHKPPMLYVYYLIFSGFGKSFAALRAFQTVVLLYTIYLTWSCFKEKTSVAFIPLLLALFSIYPVNGTNTEIIYIPFILGTFYFLIFEKTLPASACMALAVSIKYTAALDILGVVIALWVLEKNKITLFRSVFYSVLFFLMINAIFYFYFLSYNINIFNITILKNIIHSNSDRTFGLPDIPSLFLTFFIPLAISTTIQIINTKKTDPKFLLAMFIWSLFSFAQSQVTGRGYYHYFIPIFIPLSLLACSGDLNADSSLKRTSLYCFYFCISFFMILASYQHYKDSNYQNERLASICKYTDFHYDGRWIYIYRHCNVSPSKYMFVAFYKSEHFAKVSGSGGMSWLKTLNKPVIYDDNNALIEFKDGNDFFEYLKK